MSSPLDKKLFTLSILFLILAEILSFFGWLLPAFNTICFFVILAVALILSLEKLEYGIYILLAELFIGSKGYLFSLEFGETLVSIRLGLFLVVMGVWLYHFLFCHSEGVPTNVGTTEESFNQDKLNRYDFILSKFKGFFPRVRGVRMTKWFVLLFLVVLWGFIWGLIRGNNFGNVFLDFNNWLYFLLVLPVFYCIRKNSHNSVSAMLLSRNNAELHAEQRGILNDDFIKNILAILIAAVLWLGIKSLFLLYIFSHQLSWALPEIYQWVRDTGVGEVTLAGSGFYRVFMQSQIYALILFFILLWQHKNTGIQEYKNKNYWLPVTGYWLLILCLATIILSFSRSYWLGLGIGLFLYFYIFIFLLRKNFLDILKNFIIILLVTGISFAIIIAVINLPPKINGQDLTSLIDKRATEMEAAGSSRLNQLKPLILTIAKHPLLGSGFGTTVTYKTDDPRIVPVTAGGNGEFTTYAFEWGYLDMALKFGLAGLFIYLTLLYSILKRLLKFQSPNTNEKLRGNLVALRNNQTNFNNQLPNFNNYRLQVTGYRLRFGFALALISLLVVNIFSPYLNHPLGIGFVIISSLIATNGKRIATNHE